MYKFTELSKRAQLIAIGHFIKTFKTDCPNEDMTIEHARTILSIKDGRVPYSVKGHRLNVSEVDGLYIRLVPVTGSWHYYYFYNGLLYVLSDGQTANTNLETKWRLLKWRLSMQRLPLKNLGFKKVSD